MKKNIKVKIWRASAESKSPPKASATAHKFYKRHKLPHLAFCNFSLLSSFQTSTSHFTSLHPQTTLLRSLSAACWLVLMIRIPLFQQTFPFTITPNSLWLCRQLPACLGHLFSRPTISGDTSSFHGTYPSLSLPKESLPFSVENYHWLLPGDHPLEWGTTLSGLQGSEFQSTTPWGGCSWGGQALLLGDKGQDKNKWPQVVPGEV